MTMSASRIALLPATPLHHLLMESLQRPMVATSGNRSEEPIATDEREALVRLKGLADALLVHDRPIARPVDDSVVLVAGIKPDCNDMREVDKPKADVTILRRARGYAPQAIRWSDGPANGSSQGPILAGLPRFEELARTRLWFHRRRSESPHSRAEKNGGRGFRVSDRYRGSWRSIRTNLARVWEAASPM